MSAPAGGHGSGRPPNIVLILADDLGYGDVSCQNSAGLVPTPHFDRLAREGVRFADMHSNSAVCTPTRYGLLTGRYAWRAGLERGVLFGYDAALIEPGRLTLPALLKRWGYATAAFGKWHLGLEWAHPPGGGPEDVDFAQRVGGGPTDVGFDTFYGIAASLDMPPYCFIEDDRVETPPTDRIEDSPRPAFYRGGPISPGFTMGGVMPRLTERAVGYIHARRRAPDEPFFMYFATTSPHTPHVPNAQFRGASGAGTYGDFVVEWDAALGEVLRALEDSRLAEKTLVIVTSDNGADLGGGQRHHGHASNGAWTGQKADIWDGGHRVPFVARWPGVAPEGAVCEQTACLTDLVATCAGLLGEPLGAQDAPDSASLLPALLGERLALDDRPLLRGAVVHHSLDGMFALRRGRWKLVQGLGSGGFSAPKRVEAGANEPPGRVYDLWQDPQETINHWRERPDVVEEQERLLEQYRTQGHSRTQEG